MEATLSIIMKFILLFVNRFGVLPDALTFECLPLFFFPCSYVLRYNIIQRIQHPRPPRRAIQGRRNGWQVKGARSSYNSELR